MLIGNKQWQVLSLPYNYMSSNWPLRVGGIPHRMKYLIANKQGQVVSLPYHYMFSNWPLRVGGIPHIMKSVIGKTSKGKSCLYHTTTCPVTDH